MSKLTIIDTLVLPPPDENSLSRLSFNIPADAQSFSFHLWFDPVANPRGGASFRLVGPGGTQVPTSNLPFLYDHQAMTPSPNQPSFIISAASLLQGYYAVNVPVDPSQQGHVAGAWTAVVDLNNSSLTESCFTVRVCQRLKDAGEPANPQYVYSVDANLFLVGGAPYVSEHSQYIQQAVQYLNSSIFNQAGLTVRSCDLQYLSTDPATITSDLYSAETRQLVSANAVANSLNVFFVPGMKIQVDSAVGFAMLPGPQGFMSPYTCVFCSLPPIPKGLNWDAPTLARRMSHEIGHYLGLPHETSCLDTTCSYDECSAALVPNSSALAGKIKSNLMYTARPGNHLNAKQVFILKNSPLVSATAPAVKQSTRTPVTSLKVRVKTGDAVYSWWRLDGAGTDDYIYFSIGSAEAGKTHLLDDWGDDFEAGSNVAYTLDPSGLCVEDISSFTFVKRWNRLGTPWSWINPQGPSGQTGLRNGEDAWQIGGVEIFINGESVYRKDDVNKWLRDYDMTLDSWGDTIPEQNLKKLIP